MSRVNFTEEQREFVFRRDGGVCKRCRNQIYFKNRRRDQPGAWEMAHRRAHVMGGTSNPLTNIVALCWQCNLIQGTKSFAESERDMEYVRGTDKAKSFLNTHFLEGSLSFDMNSAKRKMSTSAELEEFKIKVKKNSEKWIEIKYQELRPLARRYQTTQDPSFKKYYDMCIIILEYNKTDY
jgi:hypothetical protein